jgi:hypothetical protein
MEKKFGSKLDNYPSSSSALKFSEIHWIDSITSLLHIKGYCLQEEWNVDLIVNENFNIIYIL